MQVDGQRNGIWQLFPTSTIFDPKQFAAVIRSIRKRQKTIRLNAKHLLHVGKWVVQICLTTAYTACRTHVRTRPLSNLARGEVNRAGQFLLCTTSCMS
jgi:hypothetical protein